MLKALIVGILLYSLLVAALFTFQRRIIFPANTSLPDKVQAGVSDFSEVRVTTADGLNLLGWYRPAPESRPVVVIFHGNAGHIGHRGYKARGLADAGYGVLLASYRGYGGNPGRPSESGLIADGRAWLDHLEHEGIAARSIILYGESLGTGVAVSMAAERETGAIVLEAPFTSILEIARKRYWFVPVAWLLKDPFDSMARIAKVTAPLLILHGERDDLIPVTHGRQLFVAATEPKTLKLYADSGHNDVFDDNSLSDITAFLNEVFEKR
ncbi:MAG: alpha/beta hydrolase [Rhodospirillaceae bacterium]|jgi:uncharacterized protein|nr:alpha/beta hydrolase [Rhodospirillaceae bacterium]MBT6136812.1 alpha/beta hydrolase [Rhodospirillaceae bacterium]